MLDELYWFSYSRPATQSTRCSPDYSLHLIWMQRRCQRVSNEPHLLESDSSVQPLSTTCHVITLKKQLVCYSEIYICICDSSLVCSKWTLQMPLIYNTVLCKRIQTLNQTDFIEIYILHWCFVDLVYINWVMVATSCRRDAFNQHLVKNV